MVDERMRFSKRVHRLPPVSRESEVAWVKYMGTLSGGKVISACNGTAIFVKFTCVSC